MSSLIQEDKKLLKYKFIGEQKMSRSLHQKVEAEVRRREQERLKKEKETVEKLREQTKDYIFVTFREALEVRLQKLETYQQHTVKTDDVKWYYHFKEIAEELGFVVEYELWKRPLDFDKYIFSVPAFQKGSRRTRAQLELFKFEQRLAKARREKKSEILAECKRVKQLIDEGQYDNKPTGQGAIRMIILKSELKLQNAYEKEVVENFFSRFKLCLLRSSAGEWSFNY